MTRTRTVVGGAMLVAMGAIAAGCGGAGDESIGTDEGAQQRGQLSLNGLETACQRGVAALSVAEQIRFVQEINQKTDSYRRIRTGPNGATLNGDVAAGGARDFGSNGLCVTQWTAEYFAGKDNALDLNRFGDFARYDNAIDFDWGSGGPAWPGGSAWHSNDFSVRWTKTLYLPAGRYNFASYTDDGFKLIIDGIERMDFWQDGPVDPNGKRAGVELASGTHTIQFIYYENQGLASSRLLVGREGDPVETSWTANYFANTDLSGHPVHTANPANIAYDWGAGSPAPSVPVDNFSARYEKTFDIQSAGTYRLWTRSDDGVRVYLDDNPTPVISYWQQSAPVDNEAYRNLSVGPHKVVVEYFELGGGATLHFDMSQSSQGCGDNQWKAEYFDNASDGTNRWENPVATRCETFAGGPSYDWGEGKPDVRGLSNDYFDIRWSARRTFEAGNYRVKVRGDDQIKVWIDGAQRVAMARPGQVDSSEFWLDAGEHDVRIDYTEFTRTASIDVEFDKQCGAEAVVVACTNPADGRPGNSVTYARELAGGASSGQIGSFGPDGSGRVTIRVPLNTCTHPNGETFHFRQYKEDPVDTYQGFSPIHLTAGETVFVGNRAFSDRPGTWGCPAN